MEGNTIQDNKFFMGEKEFTNLIKILSRAYRYRNKNQSPEAIVIPKVFEVDGVRVEFPTKEDYESFKEYLVEEEKLEQGEAVEEGTPEAEADIEETGREPGEPSSPDS